MRARSITFGFISLAALLWTVEARAGILGGTVKSVSGNELVLEYGRDAEIKAFRVPVRARVFRGDETLALTDLEPGTRVTVYTTSSGDVYKINVTAMRASTPRRIPGESPRILPGRDDDDDPADRGWTSFRGPDRANRSAETGLRTEWPEAGPPVAHVFRGLGAGYSSVTIADGRLFTMGTRNSDELVFAIDWNDPELLWSVRNGVLYRDSTGDGPRGTPTIDGSHVYALGGNGDLACLDVETGKAVWRKEILREYAARNIQWGISESPLVDGNRVIVTPGGTGATMVALDKETGRNLWRCLVPGTPGAAYSSAIVCQIGGVRQYVNFTHEGLIGVRADDGTALWGNNASANGTANCPTPLFHADHIFSASGYGTGGAMLRFVGGRDSQRANVLYRAREMENHHGGMVIVGNHLYGTNENSLLCMDLQDGRVIWRDRCVGKGSLTYADGHLYVVGEKGEIALVRASPEGFVETGRFRHVHRSNRPLWSHPVVHDGRLVIRDQDTLTMYDVSAGK